MQVTTILKDKEERRFEEFFMKFSRTGSTLTFTELANFALDRNLIQNKNTFSVLLKYFDISVGQNERHLTKPQFNFLLTQLSSHIFHHDPRHLDKLFHEVLSEKTHVTRDHSSIEVSRLIIFDETNKKLLTEQAIRVLCQYEEELKNIFTIYMQENLQRGNIMLKWRELSVQGKKLNTCSLIRFLRDAEIVPHILSIEQVEEQMMKIVPSVNNRENEFYNKSYAVLIYEKNLTDQFEGDPMLSFHELQLLLARIAYEVGAKEEGIPQNNKQKVDVEKYLNRFFHELMYFRKNTNIFDQLPNLNRKIIKQLEKFQNDIHKEEEDIANSDSESEVEQVDPIDQIAEQQQALIYEQNMVNLPIESIIKILDKDLPQIPPEPQPEKQMAQWDPEKRVTIGLPKPVSPTNKQQKPKANKPKNQQRKKGEPEPRKIIYEDKNPPQFKTSEQYVQELSEKLKNEQKLLSDPERGSLSDIQVLPVLIPEILYPPNPPKEAQAYIEAAINAHNQSNFIFAIQNYDEARKVWAKSLGRDLYDSLELYFEFSKGQVYESAGRDDLALQCYLAARLYSTKLPTNNPDKALAYCGLGSVLFNMEEYEWALRSFLKAREYRENLLGVESVDTATVFNNLGCCMFMIDRNKEAYAYFKLGQAVLEADLGQFHPRTLTAARNINKANHNQYNNQPEYKKIWVAYAKDQFAGAGKKKKKKSKK